MAGKKWSYFFLQRNPVCQSENISIVRAKEFNFCFNVLEAKIKLSGVDANRIYNVDAAGFSTVKKKF